MVQELDRAYKIVTRVQKFRRTTKWVLLSKLFSGLCESIINSANVMLRHACHGEHLYTRLLIDQWIMVSSGQADFHITCLDGQVKISNKYQYLFTSLVVHWQSLLLSFDLN